MTCGGFSYNEVCWETNYVFSDGQHIVDARSFLDAINDCFLYQHISDCTHNIDSENPTWLDLIFSRSLHDIENKCLFSPLGRSHHVIISFDFFEGSNKNLYEWNIHITFIRETTTTWR